MADGGTFISAKPSGLLLRRRTRAEVLARQQPGLATLTPTERRILKLVAQDRTSKEIADLLGCSVRTIDTPRQNISTKLELSGSHSLLKFACDHKSKL